MISINDVAKIDEKRKRIKKEIYTRIYEQFSRKIKQSVELRHKQVCLTIPTFVLGCPTFDRVAALKYIVRQLKLGGFDTTIISDYDVIVSWVVGRRAPQEEEEEEVTNFPDLMNLKKLANKYRKSA